MTSNKFLLGFILIVYLFFSLALLTKDPVVFPDEVEFANVAYKLINPTSFSNAPYDSQLPQVNNIDFILHGPIYFWILAVMYKIFGFSIITTRFTSILLGVLTIITGFYLAKMVLKNELLALLASFLLSIDYNFLRSTRFGRPEIAVMLFSYLVLIFYLKVIKSLSKKDYLLLGISVSISFFSHFLLGLISPLIIFFHSILQKKRSIIINKNILLTLLVPIISLAGWFAYLYFYPSQISTSTELVANRLIPSFYSIKSIFRGDIYIKLLYLIYFISFLLILFSDRKGTVRKFLLLSASIFYIVVFYGSIGWYLSLIIFPSILILIYSKYDFDKVAPFLVAAFILINFVEEFRLMKYYSKYSYLNYSKQIAEKIPKKSNVLLNKIIPDPYFYLAKERQDLKLLYNNYHKHDYELLQKALLKTDYIVSYMPATDKNIISFLENNQYSISIVNGNRYHPTIAVFNLKD